MRPPVFGESVTTPSRTREGRRAGIGFPCLVPDIRLAPRPLRDPRAARRRRDGRGLPGARHAARPRSRDQGPARRALRPTPSALARFEREAQAVAALSHPEHPRRSTTSDARRASPTSSWSSSRARRCGSGSTTAAAARKALEYAAADRARPRGRAREGHRPSRPEAGEHLRHDRRAGQDPRLRPRQGRLRAEPTRPSIADGRRATPSRARSWARSATCPRSRSAASRSTTAPTSSRSARCSTRCSPATRAFRGESAAETMAAILQEDPPRARGRPEGRSRPRIERILRHCLEKRPEERFEYGARPRVRRSRRPSEARARRRRQRPRSARTDPWLMPALGALALLAALGAGFFVGGRLRVPRSPQPAESPPGDPAGPPHLHLARRVAGLVAGRKPAGLRARIGAGTSRSTFAAARGARTSTSPTTPRRTSSPPSRRTATRSRSSRRAPPARD